MIEGMKAIGHVGQSLYDQKVAMARALAGAQMYAKQNPEVVGENQVAQTAMGPVTNNQTANYDPATGSVTPNQSPVNVSTLASAMLGMAPKDIFDNQVQNRQAKTSEGDLALKQQYKPQELAIQEKVALAQEENNRLQRLYQKIVMDATIKDKETGRAHDAEKMRKDEINDLLRRKTDLTKSLPKGLWDSINNKQAAQAKKESAQIDTQLNSLGYGNEGGLPQVGQSVKHQSGVVIKRIK